MTRDELNGLMVDVPDERIKKEIQKNWDQIAKPLHSMGKFESLTAQIGAITNTVEFAVSKRVILVFCADNGIVEEGISQSGQEVTGAVMDSMIKGQSAVCKMANVSGTDVRIIDIGVNGPVLPKQQGACFCSRKIAKGTKNFLKEPAMTNEEALLAIQTGIELARSCKEEGYHMLALGEMGIGNTTTSSAVAAALLDCPAERITGRGAGLSGDGFARKKEVIQKALLQYDLSGQDPLTILAAVGGFDLAGMAGACIGGAIYKLPVVLDGIISAAAALTAERLVPGVAAYLIPSHVSREPAALLLLQALGLSPVLCADMALGEGTGAALLFALLDQVAAVYREPTRFDAIGVKPYVTWEKTQ